MSIQELFEREKVLGGETPPGNTNTPADTATTHRETMVVEDFQPLLSMAGPDLYRKNAFRLLGLPGNATAVDVKRQFEKRQMMMKYGDNAPAMRQLLPVLPPPDEEEIRAAVVELREPEHRLVQEVLWFWPLTGDSSKERDVALEALKAGDVAAAAAAWMNENGPAAGIAIHNLAVLHHTLALDFEARRFWGDVPEEASKQSLEAWHAAYKYWLRLFREESFWSALTSRISELEEARLTTGTARRLKASLPMALLTINARLAVEAAECGKDAEARRQLQIMQASGFDGSLIDAALREAVEPIAKRIQILRDKALADAKASHKDADKATLSLLDHCEPLLETLDQVLNQGNATREHIHDQVADAAIDCIVDFGKETEDWPATRELLERVKPLAEGQQIRARVTTNLEAVESMSKGALCWFCETEPADDKTSFDVKMFGDVVRTPTYQGTRVTWKYNTIHVPRCKRCAKTHGRITKEMVIKDALLFMLMGIAAVIVWNDEYWFFSAMYEIDDWLDAAIQGFNHGHMGPWWLESVITGFPLEALSGWLLAAVIGGGLLGMFIGAVRSEYTAGKGVKALTAKNSHPDIKSYLDQGWQFGEKPNTD